MSKYRPECAAPTGGLLLIDEENTRSVVMEIIKSLGRKIIQGNFMDVMKVSRPASISYPMTYLEAVCRDFTFSELIDRAADTPDPIRRLQLITAFMISSLHINPINMKNKPPLNPILGETFHAYKDENTQIWLEQTSHHPPISHWIMVGRQYKFTGHGQLIAGLSGPNTLHASKQGKHRFEFADGGVIEYDCPHMEISGLVYGERTVNFVGNCAVFDPLNKMRCDVQFGGYQGMVQWLTSSLTSWWSKSSTPTDYFTATIKQYSDNSSHTVEILKGGGSWLDFIEFGGQEVWNIQMQPEMAWVMDQPTLPSDSRHRPDLIALLEKDIERAQRAKDELENAQRRDKTLRSG